WGTPPGNLVSPRADLSRPALHQRQRLCCALGARSIADALVGHLEIGDQPRQDLPIGARRQMRRGESHRAAKGFPELLLAIGLAQDPAAIERIDKYPWRGV